MKPTTEGYYYYKGQKVRVEEEGLFGLSFTYYENCTRKQMWVEDTQEEDWEQ